MCDPNEPNAIPSDFAPIEVERKAGFIAVQLKYHDGTTSKLERIPHS